MHKLFGAEPYSTGNCFKYEFYFVMFNFLKPMSVNTIYIKQ